MNVLEKKIYSFHRLSVGSYILQKICSFHHLKTQSLPRNTPRTGWILKLLLFVLVYFYCVFLLQVKRVYRLQVKRVYRAYIGTVVLEEFKDNYYWEEEKTLFLKKELQIILFKKNKDLNLSYTINFAQ